MKWFSKESKMHKTMSEILNRLITLHLEACSEGRKPFGVLGLKQPTVMISADELQRAIDAIKSDVDKLSDSPWVPVSERLPKSTPSGTIRKRYLVFYAGVPSYTVIRAYGTYRGFRDLPTPNGKKKATHWQPITLPATQDSGD